MNIQNVIEELGLEHNNLPRVLTQRVNAIENLTSRLASAKQEFNDEPTEENEEKLDEIQDYVEEYFKDVQEQLQTHKSKLEKKVNENSEGNIVIDEEKKSNGMGTLLLGGVILVATLGAINIFNRR